MVKGIKPDFDLPFFLIPYTRSQILNLYNIV